MADKSKIDLKPWRPPSKRAAVTPLQFPLRLSRRGGRNFTMSQVCPAEDLADDEHEITLSAKQELWPLKKVDRVDQAVRLGVDVYLSRGD